MPSLKNQMDKLLIVIFLLLGVLSCGKVDLNPQEQYDTDIKIIEDYLTSKHLTAQKTVHGVYYIIEDPGTEEHPKITNTIVMNYKGYFTDGIEFDSGTQATFPLYNLIQGWQIGIPKFGKGGKGKLLIPSKYGYGSEKVKDRANAVLIFDIELLDIL